MNQTNYPVVRRGRLVRTSIERKTERVDFVLDAEQGRTALELIDGRRAEFANAIWDAIASASKRMGLSFARREFPGLSSAARNRALGAIYDFEEIAFELDGAVVIARACVTLCVLVSESAEARKADLPFSKFWMRFILYSHPESDARNNRSLNLGDETLREFDTRCAVLSDACMAAIAPLYRKAVKDATGQAVDLDVDSNGAFSVLTVTAEGGDFDTLFDTARDGASLTYGVRRNSDAAHQLVDLALKVMADEDAPQQLADLDLKKALGDDIQYIVYETSDGLRGLFLAQFDEREARFVGLAGGPRRVGRKPEKAEPGEVSAYAANVVSGGLVQQYALAF